MAAENEDRKQDQQVAPTSSDTEKLKAEREEYLNGWKRAKADLINFKKDEERRLTETIELTAASFAKDLLHVLDSFSFALAALKNDEAAQKGIVAVKSQLEDVLKKRGVERIIVQPGDMLDVRLHEPIAEVELSPSDPEKKKLDGTIVEEVVAGYMFGEKVLRPVKVKVGKLSEGSNNI